MYALLRPAARARITEGLSAADPSQRLRALRWSGVCASLMQAIPGSPCRAAVERKQKCLQYAHPLILLAHCMTGGQAAHSTRDSHEHI